MSQTFFDPLSTSHRQYRYRTETERRRWNVQTVVQIEFTLNDIVWRRDTNMIRILFRFVLFFCFCSSFWRFESSSILWSVDQFPIKSCPSDSRRLLDTVPLYHREILPNLNDFASLYIYIYIVVLNPQLNPYYHFDNFYETLASSFEPQRTIEPSRTNVWRLIVVPPYVSTTRPLWTNDLSRLLLLRFRWFESISLIWWENLCQKSSDWTWSAGFWSLTFQRKMHSA